MNCDKALELFESKLEVINIGPKLFATVLAQQGYTAVQVDWKPVAAGDKEMQDILRVLGGLD